MRYLAGEDWQKLVKPREKYSNRVKKLKEIIKNGIITNVKDGNMPDIDIIIDELTPCLKDSKTGEILNTDFSAIKISKAKARSMMKDGWKFDWSKPFQEGFEVFQLNIKDSKAVEGLISLKNEDGFTFIGIVESAPSNFGTNGKYTGVWPDDTKPYLPKYGIDAFWHWASNNSMVFLNSYKMKLSVVVGIT